jgi:hypothetical protein
VVSAEDPYGHILGFLGRSGYFFFQVAMHLRQILQIKLEGMEIRETRK